MLQNYSLFQTVCFCSNIFLNLTILHLTKWFLFNFSFSTLQYYTFQTVCFSSEFYFWPYNITHYFLIFLKKYFQYYKITHYFRLFIFDQNIFLKLTMLHLTNCFLFNSYFFTLQYYTLQRDSFSFDFIFNLTILHITFKNFENNF